MGRFYVIMTGDGLAQIVQGEIGGHPLDVGRALTKADGDRIVEVLNRLAASHGQELRDRVLAEVTDAVENCFEGTA